MLLHRLIVELNENVKVIFHVSVLTTVSGTGRSKKTAKRKAAGIMMQQIKEIVQEGEQNTQLEESEDEDEMPLVSCN